MKIWIDFSNSPHPLLFAPIARALESRGHRVLLTARDNAQTLDLARQHFCQVDVFGTASPERVRKKGSAIANRASELRSWAKEMQPDVAVSHNSYAQIVAARWCRIPVVTAMDYEHQPANHLAFRLANRILLPNAFPAGAARRQGAISSKLVRYDGFKEEIYVGDFEPNPRVFDSVGLTDREEKVIVVTRAPPAGALYHRFENKLFEQILFALGVRDDVWCVVLARRPEQREAIRAYRLERVLVPEQAVDGRSLLYLSDVVVGAGGTMTREAAILGVRTLTIYQARPAAVEQQLEHAGLLRRASSPADIEPLAKADERRPLDEIRARGKAVAERFIDVILDAAKPTAPHC